MKQEHLLRVSFGVSTVLLALCAQPAVAQSVSELHRTFTVTLATPVDLQVDLSSGDVHIAYSREGQVSISVVAQAQAGATVPEEFLDNHIAIEGVGNHVAIRDRPRPGDPQDVKIAYTIDVPYRTEVRSTLGRGKQTIIGITGPVKAESHQGDISVSYVSGAVGAQTGLGDMDFQVIGDRVEARTGGGNVSCSRSAKGIGAETEDGDISLMVVGPSTASVKRGSGRIDAGGVRGTLFASTDAGDLHVKAVPHDDWELNSATGNVRIELPPAARFEVDTTSVSGQVLINRDDLEKTDTQAHHFVQKANGGGKRVQIRTGKGRIVIA